MMHDPMVVAFTIPSPLPHRQRWRERDCPEWRWGWHRRRRTNQENLGEPVYGWWRAAGYRFRAAGREYALGELVTVWHVEPGGRDSGEVCKHRRDGKVSHRWKWHVHHWKLQVRFVQKVHRKLFERCTLCGRTYPWGYAPVSHGWNEPAGRWFHVERHAYHRECSSLVHMRHLAEQDLEIIRGLVAYLRTVTDKSEEELVNILCDYRARWAEFHVRHRLQNLLGYERDEVRDDGRLVKKQPKETAGFPPGV